MKFGEKVRDLRKKHSLTQDELAQCLGINKRTIIGWERDGRYPRSIEMLEKMADIFHVPLTYLQPDQSLFIERAAEAYGKKGKIEAQHLAFELTELFASGELTPQDMDGIMYEMHKAYSFQIRRQRIDISVAVQFPQHRSLYKPGKENPIITLRQFFQFPHKGICITGTACDDHLFICLDILEGLNQISNPLFRHQTT